MIISSIENPVRTWIELEPERGLSANILSAVYSGVTALPAKLSVVPLRLYTSCGCNL